MVKEECDVLILSASYGGGHNQVARALTSALQLQASGIKIITVDYCDLLVPLFNRLTQFGYMQSIRHFPVGYALYYQATGKISPDSFWQRHLNKIGYFSHTCRRSFGNEGKRSFKCASGDCDNRYVRP